MKHLSDNNFNSNQLDNVPTPVDAGDAANKEYVDGPRDKENIGQPTDYHAFGDSITYGTRSTNPAVNAYPVVLAGLKGWSVTNHGYSGARVNDGTVLDVILSQIVDETKNYSLMIGTNNARINGMDLGYLDTYRGCLMNELVWLAIPDEYKIRAADCTTTGTWATNTKTVVGNGHGYKADSTGATLETTVMGSTVYISTYATSVGTSDFSIEIDGVGYDKWRGEQHTTLNTRQDDSENFSAYMIRISGLTQGAHKVKITTNVSATCYVDWIAGNGYHRNVKGPNVWISNIIRATQGQYDSSSYSDEIVGLYNSTIRSVADDLVSDNLNICFVDSMSAINNTTDMYDAVDLHPNDTGYIKLANSFFTAMSSYIKPLDRGGGQTHDTGWITPTLLNGWVANEGGYGTPQFRKVNGRVEMQGSMRSGTTANGTDVFMLPVGYRPSVNRNFAVVSGGDYGMFRVYPGGPVRIQRNGNASYMSVDNISFLADL